MTESYKELIELTLFNAEDASDSNIQLAAAILMFEIIKADGSAETIEVAEMVDILKQQFALVSDEVADLLQKIHDIPDEDFPLTEYTNLIVKNWSQEERLRLLQDFWAIALANDEIDAGERAAIDELAMMLELDEKEVEAARLRNEQKLEWVPSDREHKILKD